MSFAIASMCAAEASVTTSAFKPSITARACSPEPPCDMRTATRPPVAFSQEAANALLTSR